jgi:hypothetical protein
MNHPELVTNLRKPGQDIVAGFTEHSLQLFDLSTQLSCVTGSILFKVRGLINISPFSVVDSSITPEQADLWHMAIGLSGEAGEILDACKKYAIYCKPLDRDNLKEELGDLFFYREGMRQNSYIKVSEDRLGCSDDTEWSTRVNFQAQVLPVLHTLDRTMTNMLCCLEMTKGEVLAANIAKLQVRYSAGKYSNQQAQARADKAPDAA